MRTTKSSVTFQGSFILNRDVGALPAGSYDIEIDEEEISAVDRTAYRRTAVYFFVESQRSTRTLVITPADLDAAIRRDAENQDGSSVVTLPPD